MDGNYIITSNGNFISEDELYHWGIKGMKWGVRRYQNADGSLTAAGRRRYTNPDGSLNEKGKKYYAKERARLIAERKVIKNTQKTNDQLSRLEAQRRNNEALKKANAPKKEEAPKHKTTKDMTDEELDKAIARAKKEDEYNRLRPEPVKKPGFMEDLVTNVVKPAVMQSGKNMLVSVMDKAVKDLMKDKIDPNSYEALKKTYDKLKLQADIAELKNRKPGEIKTPEIKTWDDLIKSKQYENDRRAEALDAREKAVKEREDALNGKKSSEGGNTTKGETKNEKTPPKEEKSASGSSKSKTESKSEKTPPKEAESSTGSGSTTTSTGRGYTGSVFERVSANAKSDASFYDRVRKQQKAYGFSSNAKTGTVEGKGTSSSSYAKDASYKSYSNNDVIDLNSRSSDGRYYYNTSNSMSRPISSYSSSYTSAGNSYVTRYLNNPISGYLPALKDRDD